MELTEEQLSKVTGGGSGTIPAGGITYKTYSTAQANRYYAKTSGSTDLMCVLIDGFGCASYYTEKLVIDSTNNSWSTNRTSGALPAPANFSTTYPFVLNIKP